MTAWDEDSADIQGKRLLDSDEMGALAALVSASGIIATVGDKDLGRLGGSHTSWTRSTCPLATDANELADTLIRVILGDRRAIADLDQWRERIVRRVNEVVIPEHERDETVPPPPPPPPPPPIEEEIPRLIEEQAAMAEFAEKWHEQGFVDDETHARWHRNTEILLGDVALERHNLELDISPQTDGLMVSWQRVHPVEADVLLVGSVLDRLDDLMKHEEKLALELRAAKWWFTTWGGDATSHPISTRPFRRLEWTITDRIAVACGRPPVAEFYETPLLGCHGPRLRRAVAGLIGSHVSLFAVSDTYKGEWLFDDLCDGRQYRVDERSLLGGCETGSIAVGRLVGYTDGRYLQSQGMACFSAAEFGNVSARRDEFLRRAATLPRAVAAEMLIGEIFGPRVERPIDVRVAKSPRTARRLLRELRWARVDGEPPYGSGDPAMQAWRKALRRAAIAGKDSSG